MKCLWEGALVAIINRIFEKTPDDDVAKSLGNMIISGVENEGSVKLYYNMLATALRERKTLILANGSLSNDHYSKMKSVVMPFMTGRKLYDFNYDGCSCAVDILSAFGTPELKAEFLTNVISLLSKISDELKSKAQRYYLYAMSALDSLGESYTLKDLSLMDVEFVAEKVSMSVLPEPEKRRRMRFLEDASMYSAYLDIETCLVKLETYGLAEMFSGTVKFNDILNDGNVIMLNGFVSDDFEKKQLLFDIMFYAIEKCLERFRSTSRVLFLTKNADFVTGDYLKNVLELNSSYQYSIYMFVEDMTRFINKNGNDILDRTKSFIVFNQGSDENASFWSAFFGSREVNERSFSYTKKKSWNPFASTWDSGGVISTPRKYNTATQSFQKVNKPIYYPAVFRELKSNEAMCYLREPLMRRKTRIEE